MVKSSKKASTKSSKPITEFFTRKSITTTPYSSQPVVFIDQSGRSSVEKATKTHVTIPIVHTISTDSHISNTTTTTKSDASNLSLNARPRTVMEAVEIVSPRKATRPNGPHIPPTMPLNSMRNSKGPAPRSKSASLARRKTKFDSDSDVEKPESVVYISKSSTLPGPATPIRAPTPLRPKENFSLPTHPSARKKPRLSSPDPGVKSILGDIVPSSQSDEQEMVPTRLPQRDPALIKQHVNEWRQTAVSPTPAVGMDAFPDEMQMDVDPSPSSSLSSIGSFRTAMEGSSGHKSRASTLLASPMFGHEDTPPLGARSSPFSPLPASPIALDPETKTAMIIAKIKEKAYADNMSSPLDGPIIEFKDELEDSSDDEDIVLWSPTKGKGKSMNPIMAPQPSPITNRRSGRPSIPNPELSPSPSNGHSPLHPRRTRTVPNRGPVILTQGVPTKKGKGKTFDPLDELLREKKLADKGGKGPTAFRLAEGAIANKGDMMGEMSLENDSADWSNEEAARIAVNERARTDMKSSSPVASGSGSGGDVTLNAQDPERLLGEKHGKAVVDILDGDRKKKQVETESKKAYGLSLWSDPNIEDGMAVDQIMPILMNTGNNPLVHSLNSLINNQDFTEAALLLDSGAFAFINLTEHSSVVPYLCTLALSSHKINKSAFRLLCHIWDTAVQAVPGLPFDTVLTTLVKLGAKPLILSRFGWSVEPYVQPESLGAQQYDEILYHLVGLITSSAKTGRLLGEQVSDMIMAMLIVAHDPATSPQLYQEIVLAIDEICRSITPRDELSESLEATICTKILYYVMEQTPVNQAFVMAILAAGTGRTRRIARWTAHALITGSTLISPASYGDLPPLLPILDQLRRATHRDSIESPGIFELHDKTDYVDLRYHVQVLAVALSKVRSYVEQERLTRRAAPISSRNLEESSEMTIQTVHQAIEKLHSSISDVRAAHLDRSRAKAVLKELSMRIHYQILSSRGGGTGTGKPRNLRQYFNTMN